MSECQREIITKTDLKGNTMEVAQITHKGELITHSPAFPDVRYALRYLDSGFEQRKDDVFIYSYPKAGGLSKNHLVCVMIFHINE